MTIAHKILARSRSFCRRAQSHVIQRCDDGGCPMNPLRHVSVMTGRSSYPNSHCGMSLRSFIAPGAASKSGVRSGSWRSILLAFWALSAFVSPTATQAMQKNILVLSEGRGRISINQMESSLRDHFSGPVNFSIVDLDNPRFEQKSYQDTFAEALRGAYSNEKPDLVVTVGTRSRQFAVQYRDEVFPGVPIVFMSDTSPLPEKMWPGVTGVHSATGVQETIDLALRLHPDAQSVAVISKASGPDNDWFQAERSELLRHRDKATEIDLLGPASPELLQRVAELPPHTVVLFQLYPEDSNQPAFGAMDVLAAVAERFPTYSILPFITVGHGGVGGASYDSTADPVLAGQLAARVLSGEKVDNLPVVENSKVLISVDWRQLRRWNIPESSLPPGTRVLFREPTLWEQGRKYFLAGIAIILLQSLLIFALFWHRARRRKAELELGRSEQKFSKAFRRSPLAITIVSASDGRYIDVNEAFEIQTGWKRDEVIGRSPEELNLWVNPEQRVAFMKQLVEQANVKDLDVGFRRKDGQIRTGLGSAELIDVHGELCVLSVIADITERKQAEQAIREGEERFRLVANTAPVKIWMSGTDKLCNYFNQRWLQFTGRPLEAELGNGWVESVHPEDLNRCMDTYTQAFDRREPFQMEYRLRRHDGEYRWLSAIGVPRFNPDHSFVPNDRESLGRESIRYLRGIARRDILNVASQS